MRNHLYVLLVILCYSGLLLAGDGNNKMEIYNPFIAENKVQILDAINTTRSTGKICGTEYYAPAPPVKWDNGAVAAASKHAHYLRDSDIFTHSDSKGGLVGQRLRDQSIDYSLVGENLAAGFDDIASVIQSWIDSATHCAVLMNKTFNLVGLYKVDGRADNTYNNYWVLVLYKKLLMD